MSWFLLALLIWCFALFALIFLHYQGKKTSYEIKPKNLYIVKSSQTLKDIVASTIFQEQEWRDLNFSLDGFHSSDVLPVGMELQIPLKFKSVESGSDHIHIIQPGDNLKTIAKQYSISLKELENLNPQMGTEMLVLPGTEVILPKSLKKKQKWV